VFKPTFAIALFAILQASLPVAGKTAQGHRPDANSNGTTSALSKPPAHQVARREAPNTSNDAEGPRNPADYSHVAITVPPIHVQKDRWDYAYITASLLIAIATLVLAGTAWTQAKAAKVSAIAAKLGAEAQINAERAWMVAKMEDLPSEFVPDQTLRVVCHVRNMGKTPALLCAKGERKELQDSKYSLPDRPPTYENLIRWDSGAILPPQSEIVVFFYLFSNETSFVYNGERALWIHGFIEYRDAFDKPHETRYCFRYFPRLGGKDTATVGFYPDGPAIYNRAT
jgi:hypothetical protein